VVILDNRMPGLSGLEVAERVLAERPDQRIILYTSTLDDPLLRQARRLGITRCLSKTDAGLLADVVRQVLDAP
jgi:DNA-binding NarL/FixJ family response regulator